MICHNNVAQEQILAFFRLEAKCLNLDAHLLQHKTSHFKNQTAIKI